jgi:hypothetical protein
MSLTQQHSTMSSGPEGSDIIRFTCRKMTDTSPAMMSWSQGEAWEREEESGSHISTEYGGGPGFAYKRSFYPGGKEYEDFTLTSNFESSLLPEADRAVYNIYRREIDWATGPSGRRDRERELIESELWRITAGLPEARDTVFAAYRAM